jgi:UDP-glucose 4-epimerase
MSDLADAHVAALDWLAAGEGSSSFNLGKSPRIFGRDVVRTTELITGSTIKTEMSPRRPGDPPLLISDSTKARKLLEWQPNFSDLGQQIKHAWKRFCNGANG